MLVTEALVITVQTMWLLLPLFISNPTAVFFGNDKPIDGGRTWRDGKRILGDGKSWGGLIGGTLTGILGGLIMVLIIHNTSASQYWLFGNNTLQVVKNICLISFGALFGDMIASFFKRRANFKRGKAVPGLDQYDMIVGVCVLLAVFSRPWFIQQFLDSTRWVGLIGVFILTPILHRVANIIGYKIGIKQVPW